MRDDFWKLRPVLEPFFRAAFGGDQAENAAITAFC
jgi:hypothetical protein